LSGQSYLLKVERRVMVLKLIKSNSFPLIALSLAQATYSFAEDKEVTKGKPAAPAAEEKFLDDAVVNDLLDYDLEAPEAWAPNESGQRSRESEKQVFVRLAKKSIKVHREFMERRENEKGNEGKDANGRSFHYKPHGCLTGKLKIYDRANRTNDEENKSLVGFFQKGGEYELIARFSNGLGISQHDAKPDLRSMTLKVFDSNTNKTMDWTLMNGPVAFARDIIQWEPFMEANGQGPVAVMAFALKQQKKDPREVDYLNNFNRAVFGDIHSLATERYWSQHPYKFGSGPKGFMKVLATPAEGWNEESAKDAAQRGNKITPENALNAIVETIGGEVLKSKNYLREDLITRAKGGLIGKEKAPPIKFFLELQLYVDEDTTPLENNLVTWPEKVDAKHPKASTPIRVGEFTFDKQEFNKPERELACEFMGFTPANHRPEHRPASSLGRGRLLVYKMSQVSRGANPVDAKVEVVDQWRRHEYPKIERPPGR
jgi:hypothetical protein